MFPELAAVEREVTAFEHGFQLGCKVAYPKGVHDGIAEEAWRWNSAMGAVAATLQRPTFAELQRRRGEVA